MLEWQVDWRGLGIFVGKYTHGKEQLITTSIALMLRRACDAWTYYWVGHQAGVHHFPPSVTLLNFICEDDYIVIPTKSIFSAVLDAFRANQN